MWRRLSAKPKILFAHDRFGAFAGAEANLLATATELRARGCKVALLHGPSTHHNEEIWRDVFHLRFPLSDEAGNSQVTPALDAFQPDAIYAHNLSDFNALKALLDSGIPSVRMIHDHNLYCLRSYKYNYFTRRICERALSHFCVFPCGGFVARNRAGGWPLTWISYSAKLRELKLYRRFNRVLVATQFMKQELLRNGFTEEQIEIHAPVPPPVEPRSQSTFSERNLIVYAGQITRGKGVDILLKALAKIQSPFQCVICGDGHFRAHCEDISRQLGLSDRVVFAGYLSPEAIKTFYREASVVAMSSLWPEPFGAVGLEAMRFGLPVVAFDAGGINEWLFDGQNGFLVPWKDEAAFAARLDQLLRDKALARALGENGRRFATTQFRFADYIDRLEQLFLRLTHAKTQPAFA